MLDFKKDKVSLTKIGVFLLLNYAMAVPFAQYLLPALSLHPLYFILCMVQLAFFPLLVLLITISRLIYRWFPRLLFVIAWVFSSAVILEALATLLFEKKIDPADTFVNMLGNWTLLMPYWIVLGVVEFLLLRMLIPPKKEKKNIKRGLIYCVIFDVLIISFIYSTLISATGLLKLLPLFIIAHIFLLIGINLVHKKIKTGYGLFCIDTGLYILCVILLSLCVFLITGQFAGGKVGFSDVLLAGLTGPMLFSPLFLMAAVINYKLVGMGKHVNH